MVQKLILATQILVYIQQRVAKQTKKCYQNKKLSPFGNIRKPKHTQKLQILINLYTKFDTIFTFLRTLVVFFRIFRTFGRQHHTFELQHPPFAIFGSVRASRALHAFDACGVRGGGSNMRKQAFAHRSPCSLLLNWHASRAFDICNVMQRHLGHRRCKHRMRHSICVHLVRLGHARSSKLDSRVARLLTHSASVAAAQICKSELLRIVRLAHFY